MFSQTPLVSTQNWLPLIVSTRRGFHLRRLTPLRGVVVVLVLAQKRI
jgi:hypothetical protein